MTRFFLIRALRTLFVVLVVVTATFFITHVFTSPARLLLPVTASDADVARVTKQLGLDRPIAVQYVDYIAHAARGDFGDSIYIREPALDIVLHALPASMYLALVSIGFVLLLGLPVGLIAGMKPGSVADRVANIFSTTALSTPDFWLGIVFIIVFAVKLRWLPTSGYGGVEYVLLPALTIALRPAGRLAHVVREATAAEMSKRYVLAGRAKGLTSAQVMRRHVFKNIINPVLTLVSFDFVFLFTGYAATVEVVFAWPGLGRLAIQSTLAQDTTLVTAAVAVAAVLIATVNMLVDMVTAMVDRRLVTAA